MVGWVGLIHTDLCIEHGGPELQYMLAREVLRDAEERGPINAYGSSDMYLFSRRLET